ncbi:hypothetical protein AVEN_270158-1 [Araneus ventricosus]|uniref:Uncharacterized protein n=1 Tax=Araneus ventricosus TaxID=182803 RepID=A0A4Y2XEL7_ARAVE|nr:hypothetical protein AVEN_270158-1 [Araneus ventricosus]
MEASDAMRVDCGHSLGMRSKVIWHSYSVRRCGFLQQQMFMRILLGPILNRVRLVSSLLVKRRGNKELHIYNRCFLGFIFPGKVSEPIVCIRLRLTDRTEHETRPI